MNVTIRPWTLDDAEFIRSARNHPDLQKWFRQDLDLTSEEQIQFMTTAMDPEHHNRYLGFVIEADGQPVGFCALTPGSDFGAEFSIGVLPDHQHKGISTQAMIQLAATALKLGYRYLYSDVFVGNPALDWYTKKLGFTVGALHKDKYLKKGERVDAVYISKTLVNPAPHEAISSRR
jgi:RimJ/RimL family protein N-acetyltransferase